MEIHTNTPQDPDKEYKLDKGSARPWVNLVLVFIIIVVMKGLLITSVHFLLSVNVGLNDRGADGEKLQLHAEIQRLTALLHNITSDPQCQLCLKGWHRFKGHCYFISAGLEEDRKWTESVKYCAKHNASLAIIQYEAEMEFIVGQMSRFSETPFLWIGLSDAEAEGVWAWLDGTLLQDHRFINVQWDAEHRDCADLRGDGSVFASDCESYGPWLCEKPMDIMPEIINHLQNYWHPSSGDK
ncbi:CD209 antigen-like protein C isoform X1 [Tachysurus fulvidraco]|uniref:CD209 antigen-like protein C isoform X1 n=1 Tax=Tachysurus fulvidraco TaxID=1234273 RepID=UPI001FF005EC|nr:CD209 antigen-like protein C isoform X1 [Tachysurus fulvidraco]